jgi:hypothetical protein
MKYLGWFIILGEVTGSIFSHWNGYSIPSAIMNFGLIISGTGLIIVDRIRPNIKKQGIKA